MTTALINRTMNLVELASKLMTSPMSKTTIIVSTDSAKPRNALMFNVTIAKSTRE
jgi:hypothetical protein